MAQPELAGMGRPPLASSVGGRPRAREGRPPRNGDRVGGPSTVRGPGNAQRKLAPRLAWRARYLVSGLPAGAGRTRTIAGRASSTGSPTRSTDAQNSCPSDRLGAAAHVQLRLDVGTGLTLVLDGSDFKREPVWV